MRLNGIVCSGVFFVIFVLKRFVHRTCVMKVNLFAAIFLILAISCGEENRNVEYTSENKKDPSPLFRMMDVSITNIRFKNLIPESSSMNSLAYEYYYNGAGVAVADLDNDGLPELFFTGNRIHNKLYKNLGDFKFQDITKEAGIKDGPSWTTGVSVVDINGDGILDIYVCRSGKLDADVRANLFFISEGIENGIPKYSEQAKKLGLGDQGYSTQSLFFDYDRDGDLDMYLLNHNVEVNIKDELTSIKSRRDPLVGDKLFRNDNMKFTDVSKSAGIIGNEIGYGLGVSAGDLNNDGWPDLYIANDYSEHDYLYFNNKDGSFTESIKSSTGHISNSSMGTDIADYNNDGWLDIVVMDMITEDNYGLKTSFSGMGPDRFEKAVKSGLHYQYMVNTLQLNMGNGQFSEAANLGGATSTNWSWAPLLADFDNDGYKDLFISNGIKRDFINYDFRNFKIKRLQNAEKNKVDNVAEIVNELIMMTPQRKVSNYVFKNNGDLTFTDQSANWGISVPSFSNGAVYGDLDNDGDLDLIINNVDDFPYIFQNILPTKEHNFIKIQLVGPAQNKDGIGTRVDIWHGKQRQTQEHFLTRGYQSAVDKGLHFGLGKDSVIQKLQVTWPDGKIEVLENVVSNRQISIKHDNAESAKFQKRKKKVLFEKYTKAPFHKHQENEYDDFSKEGLLPYKTSQLGSGIAVSDVDNDGLEDFYVGGAKGFTGALFYQNSDGTFRKSLDQLFEADKMYEDIDAVFFDANGDNLPDLYVVSGGNEYVKDDPYLKDRLYLNSGNGKFQSTLAIPEIRSSNSCVKPCDFDKDGDYDLFVGGRLVPGKYPYPASSFLLENVDGKFENVSNEKAIGLVGLGMVTDAAWADFDSDGWQDLVILGEWMPITIFKNNQGSLSRESNTNGLDNSEGWWNSLAVADFDKDGDVDFVAGNLGLNSKFKTSRQEPFQVFASDFDNSGSLDIVFGYYNEKILYPFNSRDKSISQMPFIKGKYPRYHEFGLATLEDVFGAENLESAHHYSVHTFATSYIENLGDGKFRIVPLQNIAQLSSTKSIVVNDFNNDGNPDIVIGGNTINTEIEIPRIDGSYGLAMAGDGSGNFIGIHPSESNLYLTGEIPDMEIINLGSGVAPAILTLENNGYLSMYSVKNNAVVP